MTRIDISVILPVYNGASTLAEAFATVCAQPITDMEIIVWDDGSKDESWALISSFTDPRLRAFSHANKGLAATLNCGIAQASGRYIARQDRDDLVLPGRLAKQLAFLDAHPDIAMVGTWAQIYEGDTPTERYHRHPITCETLRLELLFDNPFVHSSMMIRTEVLRDIGGYCEDKSRQPPEDYELWSRIARRHRVANIPEVLTVYREVPGSISRTGISPFLRNVILIASENLLAVLASRHGPEKCVALAELYHGVPPGQLRLSRSAARRMLADAAKAVGGAPSGWSEEFLASYQRMRRHLDSRFLRRWIPAPLLGPARWLKYRLVGRKPSP